jgi:hypothetical protein
MRLIVRAVLVPALFVCATGVALAQAAESANTIREALTKSGVGEAIEAAGAPFLDVPLTSSEYAVAGDTFVVGYYLRRELDGGSLGPLRVSRFDRRSRLWTHAVDPRVHDSLGSVLRIRIQSNGISLYLHGTPSSGKVLVLEPAALGVILLVDGNNGHVLRDGTVVFEGPIRHFSQTHQSTLWVLDHGSPAPSQVFPGPKESTLATQYRRRVVNAYRRLPAVDRQVYESSVYGPVTDFDRSFADIVEAGSADAGRANTHVVFAATYESASLGGAEQGGPAEMITIVSCQRDARRQWRCSEKLIEDVATSVGLRLTRSEDGGHTRASVDAIVRRVAQR